MPPSHHYVPMCRGCGAFLSPEEREYNLKATSELLMYNSTADLMVDFRIYCFPCWEDDSPDPDIS